MKTTSNNSERVARKPPPNPRKGAPRKSIENRDLNVDDQITNGSAEEDGTRKVHDATPPSDRSVEEEEDRETKRKIADVNPEDDIQK